MKSLLTSLALVVSGSILFTTGYTRNAIVHNGMLDPGVVLLSKPFTLEELARKMAELAAK